MLGIPVASLSRADTHASWSPHESRKATIVAPIPAAADVSEVASVPLRTTDTLDMLLRSVVDAAAADAGGGGGGGGGITGWGDVLAGQQAASAWSRLSTPLDAVPVGRSGWPNCSLAVVKFCSLYGCLAMTG